MITIPFTIPGERVRATVRRVRDGTLVGSLDEILEAAPYRVAPPCPHFGLQPRGGCGGCSWQHIAYEEQLRLKARLVTRLVRETVPQASAALPTIAATPIDRPWAYRQKVHFVFGNDAGTALTMGHYARGSRRVVPVSTCPVHDERGNRLAFRFHQTLRDAGVTLEDQSVPKSVAVRVGTHTTETMVTLVLTDDADRRVKAATRRLIDAERPSSVYVNIHPRGDAYIFGRVTRRITGSERMREEVAGVSFLMSPTAFFQTNVRAAEILTRLVVDASATPSRILDLYAGAGLFALPLARAGHQVVAVEDNRESVADGEASRRLNGISDQQCRFVARRVEEAVRAMRQPFEAVVLDPPRAGCSAPVIKEVFGNLSPSRAIYVSCNPEALARDLRQITRFGYQIRSLQPVDMFPHTAHVETVAILERRP